MSKIQGAWWLSFGAVIAAWLMVEPDVFTTSGFIPLRNLLVQGSGLLAVTAMSLSLFLATRPRRIEPSLGGLDKMYRLHKWLGITALTMSVFHWSASNAPKWATALGLLEPSTRGPRAAITNPLAQRLANHRGVAEALGEWSFYAASALILIALTKWIPYRLFYRTHGLLAVLYLPLVLHAIVLTKFSYWFSPVGLLLVPLLIIGVWSSIVVLRRRVGFHRRAQGKISTMHYYKGVHTLELTIAIPKGWSGHAPGQFAFVTSSAAEGAHPYTIASAWNDNERHITLVIKALGDHTSHLRELLHVGQDVTVEGPYGCFTFEDSSTSQIWVGGGVGITPFIARMKYLAASRPSGVPSIHLFHPTAEFDEEALAKLAEDAKAAGVILHVLVDARDGRLDGARIRAEVSTWADSSLWFCGPPGLGKALKQDFALAGLDVSHRFHQEFFAMR